MADTYNYFSFPEVPNVYPVYLLVYGLVMPALTAVIVNWLVIRRKLAQPALKLMRKEQKQGRFGRVNLGKMGFVSRFCVRQLLPGNPYQSDGNLWIIYLTVDLHAQP